MIKQDNAKRFLSVSVYNHYKRILQKARKTSGNRSRTSSWWGQQEQAKRCWHGPSFKRLGAIHYRGRDSTTEAGYVGEDISILTRLLQVADYDVNAAERGSCLLMRLIRSHTKNDNPSITRDVSGEGCNRTSETSGRIP